MATWVITPMNIAMMMVYWTGHTDDNMGNDDNEHCYDDRYGEVTLFIAN